MFIGHVSGQRQDPQPGQARRQIGVAVVQRQHMAALHGDAFVVTALHGVGRHAAAAHAHEPHDAVVRVLQVLGVFRHAVALQIGGRGVGADLQLAHPARDQRRVGDVAPADHAVHAVADQVHHAVAHAHVDLDVGVHRMEARQRGHQHEARERAGYVHAEPAAG